MWVWRKRLCPEPARGGQAGPWHVREDPAGQGQEQSQGVCLCGGGTWRGGGEVIYWRSESVNQWELMGKVGCNEELPISLSPYLLIFWSSDLLISWYLDLHSSVTGSLHRPVIPASLSPDKYQSNIEGRAFIWNVFNKKCDILHYSCLLIEFYIEKKLIKSSLFFCQLLAELK